MSRERGKPCTYCRRLVVGRRSASMLAATMDHVIPKSRGGTKTVLACRQCNSLKRDMMPDEWEAFMSDNPTWWLKPQFGGPRQVGKPKPIPYAESMRILAVGKKAWRTERERREQELKSMVIPTSIPVAYEDSKAQAAFENVYRNRLHMLRVPKSFTNSP